MLLFLGRLTWVKGVKNLIQAMPTVLRDYPQTKLVILGKGEGSVNGVMAHPLLLRWNGMKWKPKRAMNAGSMKVLEARISRLQPWRVSKYFAWRQTAEQTLEIYQTI